MFNKIISIKTNKIEEANNIFEEKNSFKTNDEYFSKNIYQLKNEIKLLSLSVDFKRFDDFYMYIDMKPISGDQIKYYTSYEGKDLELNFDEVFEIEEIDGRIVLNMLDNIKYNRIKIEYPEFIEDFNFGGYANINFIDKPKINVLNLFGNSICY